METIQSQKNNIIQAFNAVVPAPVAQQLFKQRLTPWESANTYYNSVDKFIGIFAAYASSIAAAVAAYNAITASDPQTSKRETRHKKGTTTTTKHTGNDTYTNGEQSSNDKQYVYPQGLIQATDTAYLAAENNSVQPETVNTQTYDTTNAVTASGEDTDTETAFDLSVFIEHSNTAATQLDLLIQACIFDIIPTTIITE